MECIINKELENLKEVNRILELNISNIEETFNVPVSDFEKLEYIRKQIEQIKESKILSNITT